MAYQFKNMTVLIVESTRAMSDLVKSVLTTFGVTNVHTAYDATEGFESFCRLEPDLVIIDWLEEPDNGLELTRRIRNSERSPNPFTPIILMTGYSQKRRVLAARDSGITEFLVKPFTAKALYQRIEQIIEVPRYFVVSEQYFGPDRRRKRDGEYGGPERRSSTQPAPRQIDTPAPLSTGAKSPAPPSATEEEAPADDTKGPVRASAKARELLMKRAKKGEEVSQKDR